MKKKSEFLYHPDNPDKSFNVYVNKNPKNTINIKYKTLEDTLTTIKKLEKLYKSKKYSHKRISQVAMILKVRLGVIQKHKKTLYKKSKNVKKRYNISKKYYDFLKERTKKKSFRERKSLKFKY